MAQLVGRLVWDQDAASSSLATRTKSPESAYAESGLFCLYGETRKIKCGADERRQRGFDRADPLSAPFGADANESRHSDQNRQFSLQKLAVLTLEFGDPGTFVAGVTLIYSVNLIWIAAVRFKAIR